MPRVGVANMVSLVNLCSFAEGVATETEVAHVVESSSTAMYNEDHYNTFGPRTTVTAMVLVRPAFEVGRATARRRTGARAADVTTKGTE